MCVYMCTQYYNSRVHQNVWSNRNGHRRAAAGSPAARCWELTPGVPTWVRHGNYSLLAPRHSDIATEKMDYERIMVDDKNISVYKYIMVIVYHPLPIIYDISHPLL